jgi:site-specific recombinase XerD
VETIRRKRDRAIIAVLAGCGLRRSEVAQLTVTDIQQRDDRWVIVDLYGKVGTSDRAGSSLARSPLIAGRRVAQVRDGRIFRCVNKMGAIWGDGITEKAIWCVVKEYASKAHIGNLARHDMLRTCSRLCHLAGGELEQIQFLLGHVSVQTTEKYLGCKQKLRVAVTTTSPLNRKISAARRPARSEIPDENATYPAGS